MREFIYYSEKARTVGNFGDDLMKAGRIDIACQIVIMSFFISHKLRDNVKLHLIFNGPPDAPKHIEMFPGKALAENSDHDISKKDVAGLIKKLLYKYKPGINNEVMPGYFITSTKNSYSVKEETGAVTSQNKGMMKTNTTTYKRFTIANTSNFGGISVRCIKNAQ